MAKRSKRSQKTPVDAHDLVVITLAEDIEQARDYESVLTNNEIPVVIREQGEGAAEAEFVAVMVPEDFIDEANVIIESQSAYDDFYDLAFEDEAFGDEYEDDFFEEEF